MSSAVGLQDVRLADLGLPDGAVFHYPHDFGDNWQVEIAVEKVSSGARNLRRPKA